jgi:hypothetical protein
MQTNASLRTEAEVGGLAFDDEQRSIAAVGKHALSDR